MIRVDYSSSQLSGPLHRGFAARRPRPDLRAGVLTVPRSKNGETRHVPMTSEVRNIFSRLARPLDSSALVFPNTVGTRDFRWAKKTFLAAVRAAEIDDFRFHDLRHTFASRLAMEAVDLLAIKDLGEWKSLESAFVLIDTFDLLRATLRAHCRGQVGGPAIAVAAAADHRSASPHTLFRLFQPTAQFSGTPDQIASDSRQQQELLWRFHARLAQLTSRPAEEIAEDMRCGRSLDAREALDYGLIDEISTTR
jgi:hypothetical protein